MLPSLLIVEVIFAKILILSDTLAYGLDSIPSFSKPHMDFSNIKACKYLLWQGNANLCKWGKSVKMSEILPNCETLGVNNLLKCHMMAKMYGCVMEFPEHQLFDLHQSL